MFPRRCSRCSLFLHMQVELKTPNKTHKTNITTLKKLDKRKQTHSGSWNLRFPFYSIYSRLRVCMLSLQLCPTLWDPTDCSPPGSSVHGILQARILEWVAIPFSRGSSHPGMEPMSLCLLHWQAGSLPLVPPGKPILQTRCLEMLKGTDKIKTEKSHLSLAKGPGKGETDNIKNF